VRIAQRAEVVSWGERLVPCEPGKKRPVFNNDREAASRLRVQCFVMKSAMKLDRGRRQRLPTLRCDVKSRTILNKKHVTRVASQTGKSRRSAAPLQIHNVLVPVDFSTPSLSAVGFAFPLIKKFGAELHLVHVFPRDYPITALVAMPLVLPEFEINKSVHRHLKDVAKKYSIELRPGNIHVLKGRPFQEICRLARNIEIDLIIIATRGNTGFKHLVLGSTAERVVRYSPFPVLVVRSGAAKAGKRQLGFKKILVPIDFSECSMQGLSYANAFAKQFKSKLVLLNSVHFEYYFGTDEHTRYDLPRLQQYAEKSAREQMRDLVRRTDWNGLKVEPSMRGGHPGQQICEHAKDADVDLIITSTHGTTGFRHVLLGSTAEYVIRHAQCPVLVVPTRLS
jgi:nucleotide-binding universal stress UspA family protein